MLMDVPVMRDIDRSDDPSTSIWRIVARFVVSNRLISYMRQSDRHRVKG